MERTRTGGQPRRAGLPAAAERARPVGLARFGPALSLLLILALVVWVALRQLTTPAVVTASAPASEFSAVRALAELQAITAGPHVVGSPENATVRQYLIDQIRALGLEPEVQTTSQAVAEDDTWFRAGVVSNVVVRVPGTNSRGAIAVDAHYDSVNTGPGAGDCGSCVVTALETLRALRSGPPLQNDLLFVFSDGEERHMLGAAAFNEQSPLAGDVRLTLNFEAQGSGGPAFLYVTSHDDDWLVTRFLQVAPDASAYSLLASISDLYPSGRFDSDLGWYTARGSQGLGFIYVGDTPAYHTARDSYANVDAGSIQQEGGYTLALLRHFGNLDLTTMPRSSGDAVFFTLVPGVVAHYGDSWVLPLAAAITLLLAGLLLLGRRRRALSIGGVALGLAAFLVVVVAAVAAAVLLWVAVRSLNPVYQVHLAGSYQSSLDTAALALAALAVVAALYALLGCWLRRDNLVAGVLLGWTALLWLLSLTAPPLSYLASWPLLFGLLPLAWVLLWPRLAVRPWLTALVLAVAAVPSLLLLPGTLYQIVALVNRFEGALDWPVLGLATLFVAPVLALLVPQLHFLAGRASGRLSWAAPALAALLALGLIVYGNATAGFSAAQPRPDRIAYVLDADSGQARWVSLDASLDDYTGRFFPAGTGQSSYTSLIGSSAAFVAPAPAVELAPPEVAILGDTLSGDTRTLDLRLSSPRGLTEMTTVVQAPGEIVAAAVDGRPLDLSGSATAGEGRLQLIYADVQPGGWRLTLSVRSSAPLRLWLEETSDGLPHVPGLTSAPRPADTMPAFDYPRDPTIVTRTLRF